MGEEIRRLELVENFITGYINSHILLLNKLLQWYIDNGIKGNGSNSTSLTLISGYR